MSEEPLFSVLAKKDEATRSVIRNKIISDTAELLATQDKRFVGSTSVSKDGESLVTVPNLTAYAAATTLYQRMSTGGGAGIMKSKAYDDEGNWAGYNEAEGAFSINIDVSPSDAFQHGWFEEPKPMQFELPKGKPIKVDVRNAGLEDLGLAPEEKMTATGGTKVGELKAFGKAKAK